MVAAHVAEGPAALCGLLLAVHRERGDVVTLIRSDGVALAVAAKHLGRADRCDAAALAGRGGDGVAVACEGSRYGMIVINITEKIAADGT